MHAGSEAELLFSLPYAPPEVATAAANKATSIKVDGAVDIWALGIIAFELLTRQRVFVPFETPAEAIMAQLQGREPLPWEGPDKDKLLPRLRALKRSILSCLAMDPAERPTSVALLGKWNSLFESETGTTREKFKL
jgi:serine/threonine protein kinase